MQMAIISVWNGFVIYDQMSALSENESFDSKRRFSLSWFRLSTSLVMSMFLEVIQPLAGMPTNIEFEMLRAIASFRSRNSHSVAQSISKCPSVQSIIAEKE
jgi:hypothetical protein